MNAPIPELQYQFEHLFLPDDGRIFRVTLRNEDCFLLKNFNQIDPSIYGDPDGWCACVVEPIYGNHPIFHKLFHSGSGVIYLSQILQKLLMNRVARFSSKDKYRPNKALQPTPSSYAAILFRLPILRKRFHESSVACSGRLGLAFGDTNIMSLEAFAFENLKKRHPNIKKNGLRACLREFDAWEMLGSRSYGFIPDATEIVDKELVIYEIEDTSKLTLEKLSAIQMFCHDLYDTAGFYSRLVVTDRYGMTELQIWDVKDEIAWTYGRTGEWLNVNEIEKREKEFEQQKATEQDAAANP